MTRIITYLMQHHEHQHSPMGRALFLALLSGLITPAIALSQSRLWISGSAVPGGTQPLTRFDTDVTGKYSFKYHGKLLPGKLYVQTTDTRRDGTYYYGPRQVDANIVNNGILYLSTRDSTEAAWTVLFEADNYRFTVLPSEHKLTGELFTQWYEAWIVGGCVEDNQGSGSSAGQWQVSAGKAMTRSPYDPNVWSWTGELKVYTSNVESNRLKINGQYGWTPKVLHPFCADQALTSATQFWYCGPDDTKWTISKDGYYYITINVFEETMHAEYLGTTIPSGLLPTPDTDAQVNITGRDICVTGSRMLFCNLYTTQGEHIVSQTGTQVSLRMPAPGTYLLHVSDGKSAITRKIITQ
ncbi:MAG: T9SS type A sorting domain-containing protein [Bacteroidaceae bacterium]